MSATTSIVEELAFTEGRRLAADPNIAAVAVGPKLRAGQPAGAPCLQFLVRRKLPAGALASEGTWPVPASIAGVPTDVVAVGALGPGTSDRAPAMGTRGQRAADPLLGGLATAGLGTAAPGPGGYGTLGLLCYDTATGAPLALSAAHVWGQATGTEAVSPVLPRTVLGIDAAPVVDAVGLVRADVAAGVFPVIAFANAGAWSNLITGPGNDPLVFGQGATPVAADARTDTETEAIVAAASPGAPPAGAATTVSVSWTYQRLASTAELDAATTQNQTNDRVLGIQKASTDAPTYGTTATIKLAAEILPPAGGAADSVLVVAHIYPLPAADRVARRLLRPVANQPAPGPGHGFQFAGTINASELGIGRFGISVVVQDLATGIASSANTATSAAGIATLVSDATFSIG